MLYMTATNYYTTWPSIKYLLYMLHDIVTSHSHTIICYIEGHRSF